MAVRQESAPEKRAYTVTPRPVPGIPKYRTGGPSEAGVDYSRIPDYEKLPGFTLIGISEVQILTGMSRSVVERRIKAGQFPAARKNGKDRVWPLGVVREWCERMAYADEEEAVPHD